MSKPSRPMWRARSLDVAPNLRRIRLVTLIAGTILARCYRLLHPIGEGGMGCVWVAEHLTLDRKVAVKVITDEVVSSPEIRERFEREARATARVDNPHVVRVLDFDFTDDGQPFMVLELLEGETLEERIVRSGPLSIEEVLALVEQASEALGAAHACGVLHRDIKSENLFLQRGPGLIDLKLFDFGIALRKTPEPQKRTTAEDGPIGTPQYMSPEQIYASIPVTEQSDRFSLAVCVYYALTGEFPFRGESPADIWLACLRGTFAPPSTLRPLPASVDAWFERALAVDPTMRFATTADMSESFALALATPPPLQAPRRRTRLGLLLAFGTLVAGAALLVMHPTFPKFALAESAASPEAAAGGAFSPAASAELPAALVVLAMTNPSPTEHAMLEPSTRPRRGAPTRPQATLPPTTPPPTTPPPTTPPPTTPPPTTAGASTDVEDPLKVPSVAPSASVEVEPHEIPEFGTLE